MYHIVKPITEWYHYDCEPKPGSRPISHDQGGEPRYDYHDILPKSRRGADYLSRCHSEARHHEEMENRRTNHIDDASRYAMQLDPRHMMVDWGSEPSGINFKQKRKKKMTTIMTETQSLAVALLNNFTTVTCRDSTRMKTLTFKKPLDMVLEKGDLVVCSFNDGAMKILKVADVHKDIVNPEDIKLCWIIQKVDDEQLDHLNNLDQKAVNKIKQMQQNKARRELLEEFDEDELKSLGEELEIKALPSK